MADGEDSTYLLRPRMRYGDDSPPPPGTHLHRITARHITHDLRQGLSPVLESGTLASERSTTADIDGDHRRPTPGRRAPTGGETLVQDTPSWREFPKVRTSFRNSSRTSPTHTGGDNLDPSDRILPRARLVRSFTRPNRSSSSPPPTDTPTFNDQSAPRHPTTPPHTPKNLSPLKNLPDTENFYTSSATFRRPTPPSDPRHSTISQIPANVQMQVDPPATHINTSLENNIDIIPVYDLTNHSPLREAPVTGDDAWQETPSREVPSIQPHAKSVTGRATSHGPTRQAYTRNKSRRSNTRISALGRKSSIGKPSSTLPGKAGFRSRLGFTPAYNHGDFLDQDLLISAARLDSTLRRLFARKSRDGQRQTESGLELLPFMAYSQSDLINMEPVLWVVYPMEATHRETLELEMPFLEENISSEHIAKHLYQHEIITHLDYNQLHRTEGQGHRAVTRLMVKTLQNRGSKAYPAFLEALRVNNYQSLCQRLADTERSLRQHMSAHGTAQISDINRLPPTTARHESSTPHDKVPEFDTLPSRLQESQCWNQPTSRGHTEEVDPVRRSTQDGHCLTVIPDPAAADTITSGLLTMQPEQLEQQLRDLMAALQDIQEDVQAMKSVPSTQDHQPARVERQGSLPDSPCSNPQDIVPAGSQSPARSCRSGSMDSATPVPCSQLYDENSKVGLNEDNDSREEVNGATDTSPSVYDSTSVIVNDNTSVIVNDNTDRLNHTPSSGLLPEEVPKSGACVVL